MTTRKSKPKTTESRGNGHTFRNVEEWRCGRKTSRQNDGKEQELIVVR